MFLDIQLYNCSINDGDCLDPRACSFCMVASDTLLPVEPIIDPQRLSSWLINDLPGEVIRPGRLGTFEIDYFAVEGLDWVS